MKRVLLLDTSTPINNRNQKIIDSLERSYKDLEIHVLTWERYSKIKVLENYHVFKKDSPPGKRFKKLILLFEFRSFVHKIIKQVKPDIIIASHWDTLITIPRRNKNFTLVYENLDIPTGRLFFRSIISFLEKKALSQTDFIIHASRFFKPLYRNRIPQFVLENKPVFNDCPKKQYQVHEPLIISFIGSIRYPLIFKNLIDSVKHDKRIKLNLHGFGSDWNEISEYARGFSNIELTGLYNYNDISGLYNNSDVIWAAYPNKDYNVKFAISNKFHESLYFGKPCIYSDNTELGRFVTEHNIGIVVNPYDILSIKQTIDKLYQQKEQLKFMSENMGKFYKKESSWAEDFKCFDSIINYKL